MACAGDLFSWRDEADAADAVARAEALREQARRKLHSAPHGALTERRRAYEAATRQALAAEVELQRIRRANQGGRA